MVRMLVEAGADVDAKDNDVRTGRGMAIWGRWTQMMMRHAEMRGGWVTGMPRSLTLCGCRCRRT
eukprot:2207253-Rhodomonas_salina.1